MFECPTCKFEYHQTLRPVISYCGHTVCYTCFEKLKECPVCQKTNSATLKNPLGLKGVFNMILEKEISSNAHTTSHQIPKETFKGLHYCFDCSKPFRKYDLSFLPEEHSSHQFTDLGAKQTDLVKNFLWVQQDPKVEVNGGNILASFGRVWLHMSDSILQDIQAIQEAIPSDSPREPRKESNFRRGCRTLVEEGEASENLPASSKVKALLHLKTLEVQLHRPLWLVARALSPLEPLQRAMSLQYLQQTLSWMKGCVDSVPDPPVPLFDEHALQRFIEKTLLMADSAFKTLTVPHLKREAHEDSGGNDIEDKKIQKGTECAELGKRVPQEID